MTIIFQEENFKSIRPKPLIIFFEYVIYRQDLIKKHEKRCDFFFLKYANLLNIGFVTSEARLQKGESTKNMKNKLYFQRSKFNKT